MTTDSAQVTITLADAERAIGAGRQKAEEFGIPFTITIIDGGAQLIAAARIDGAALASIETSQTKARTSVMFGAATKDLAAAVQPGAPLFGIEAGTRDPLAFVAGGIPVTDADGRAIGAGGGSPNQDHEIAAAAYAAI